LSRGGQAGTKVGTRAAKRLAPFVPIAALCGVLAGCGGGMGLRQVEADTSILTSAVAPDAALAGDPQKISDQTTIRNAVSSANVEELGGSALSWANADTQSRGCPLPQVPDVAGEFRGRCALRGRNLPRP
jgi:hypothetical protein